VVAVRSSTLELWAALRYQSNMAGKTGKDDSEIYNPDMNISKNSQYQI
jgi:hypothetical protein